MSFVRITAVLEKGLELFEGERISLLCKLDAGRRILKGEWFGYVESESISYPFILRNAGEEVFYGYEGNVSTRTNIGEKSINFGEIFAYTEDGAEYVYKIIHIYPYE